MLCFRLNYLITEPRIFIYTKPVSLYIKAAFRYRKINAHEGFGEKDQHSKNEMRLIIAS